jgi:hypothetical protein
MQREELVARARGRIAAALVEKEPKEDPNFVLMAVQEPGDAASQEGYDCAVHSGFSVARL